MPEEPQIAALDGKNADAGNAKGRSKDEVALELMKFIAVTTGYGKGNTSAARFVGQADQIAGGIHGRLVPAIRPLPHGGDQGAGEIGRAG